MIKHLKDNFALYLFGISIMILSVTYPDLEITVQGGLAWFVMMFIVSNTFLAILVLLFGGEISYKSKGLFPLIKEIKNKKRDD